MSLAPSELKGRYTMSMRFIRWILPLLVVLTIAIVFAVLCSCLLALMLLG